MKNITINRRKTASVERQVEEFTPTPNPPAACYEYRIVLEVSGKRFELTRHTEVREITRGPAIVIEMPARPAIEL